MERESFIFEIDDVANPIINHFFKNDIVSKPSDPKNIEFPDLWSFKNIGNLFIYIING
jgi:hypothetical protein